MISSSSLSHRLPLANLVCASLLAISLGCDSRKDATPSRPLDQLPPPPATSDAARWTLKGSTLLNPTGQPDTLRGVDLAGWLDFSIEHLPEAWIDNADKRLDAWSVLARRLDPETLGRLKETHLQTFITESDLATIAAAGLNTLRVPLAWSMTRDPQSALARITPIADLARNHGLHLILALRGPGMEMIRDPNGHHRPGRVWEQPENLAHALSFWEHLATHLAKHPAILAFEPLDEPEDMPAWQRIMLYDELVAAFATFDPDRWLILSDARLGLHALPSPASRGWSNILYAIHSDSPLLQRRTALDLDVPLIVQPLGARTPARQGTDALLNEIDLLNGLGWSWTFSPYKRYATTPATHHAWTGLVPHLPPPAAAREHGIVAAWTHLLEQPVAINPLIPSALAWRTPTPPAPATPTGRTYTSVRDLRSLPAHPSHMWLIRHQGQLAIARWGRGDAIAWNLPSEQGGYRRIGLTGNWDTDTIALQLWVNGVLTLQRERIPPPAHHPAPADIELGSVLLAPGSNQLELRLIHGDAESVLITSTWSEPATAIEPALESALWLRPSSLRPDHQPAPPAIAWNDEPPAFLDLPSSAALLFPLKLRQGGRYRVVGTYSTPNLMSRILIANHDQPLLASFIPTTGSAHRFNQHELGILDLGPGDHLLSISLQSTNSANAGSLRDLRFQRITGMDAPGGSIR
ncbi:MAG TPA: cellulase family glycosylhydrolase [Kiritimatiellia bacterium]|nr:cellulase family glycosylhydrolase [Kiritimatiellia bacterium]